MIKTNPIVTVDYSHGFLDMLNRAGIHKRVGDRIIDKIGPEMIFPNQGMVKVEIEDCVPRSVTTGVDARNLILSSGDGWKPINILELLAYYITLPKVFRYGSFFSVDQLFEIEGHLFVFMFCTNRMHPDLELLIDHPWQAHSSNFLKSRQI